MKLKPIIGFYLVSLCLSLVLGVMLVSKIDWAPSGGTQWFLALAVGVPAIWIFVGATAVGLWFPWEGFLRRWGKISDWWAHTLGGLFIGAAGGMIWGLAFDLNPFAAGNHLIILQLAALGASAGTAWWFLVRRDSALDAV